ncbi:hypothetical protein ABVF33_04325 [Candidatus Rickettsia barbariae]
MHKVITQLSEINLIGITTGRKNIKLKAGHFKGNTSYLMISNILT